MTENVYAVWAGVVGVVVLCIGGAVLALRRNAPSFRMNRVPETPLDFTNPLVSALRDELRALEAMPIASKADRDEWYDQAAKVNAKLSTIYASISESLPHELDHYLSDADIRAKEPLYAEDQKRQLLGLLEAAPSCGSSTPSD